MAENGLNTQDLEAQKNEISEYIKKPLKKGDIWYLVDSRWFKQWKKYVGYDDWDTCNADKENTHPGPIDNSALYKEVGSGELNEYLVEEIGYVLLPQECWDRLVSWYTLLPSQDPIARNVVEYGMFSKQCKVEVYLMEVKLCQNNDLEHCINHKFSRSNTIEHVDNVFGFYFHRTCS
ncbi:ubiquitin carboxyl-terminal hydrolase 15-like [Limulus polyphemus]|uniref:Ubiquitin carboxyl-terminal hydrolase 15-like n=1 Tax=Limulus polyphemus TaxID=6850 RepID=A0ABM1BX42_LIMPO|nr:ubiquitin carboxyl-terminal hydrolase 15-like [Limulus polyphemus]